MDWLQKDDVKWNITCAICKKPMEFFEPETCASADRGKHPHFRCPRCNLAGACFIVKLKSEGDA